MPTDPRALLRSRDYLRLLALAAILGVPVSAAAYGFLALARSLSHALKAKSPEEAAKICGLCNKSSG